MNLITSSAALFVLTFAALVPAQDMPKPTAEHQKLAAAAGTWDTAIEMMGMDGKPVASKGTAEVKMAIGGFWLIEDFKGEIGGMPFEGHGLIGWDAAKGKYVGSWVDSMGPHMMMMEGTVSADGKTTTMTGMAPSFEGKLVQHRMVTTWKDANTRVFEMHVPGPDGKEMKVLTITYTRRAAKNAGPADKVVR